MDVLKKIIQLKYTIGALDNPNSTIGWYAHQGDYRMANVYDVFFVIDVDKEKTVYHWIADLERFGIGPGDDTTMNIHGISDS